MPSRAQFAPDGVLGPPTRQEMGRAARVRKLLVSGSGEMYARAASTGTHLVADKDTQAHARTADVGTHRVRDPRGARMA